MAGRLSSASMLAFRRSPQLAARRASQRMFVAVLATSWSSFSWPFCRVASRRASSPLLGLRGSFGSQVRGLAAVSGSVQRSAAGEPREILDFWFADPSRIFKKDPAFDEEIRSRFADTIARARAGEMDEWKSSGEGSLALVILLDQMTRNIFRGDANAFASDEKALQVAKNAVSSGLDQDLDESQRKMLYMPFMHSESLDVQKEGLTLWEGLGDEKTLSFAVSHMKDIEKFGRFPGRNEALGRTSTAEELEYLKAGGGY